MNLLFNTSSSTSRRKSLFEESSSPPSSSFGGGKAIEDHHPPLITYRGGRSSTTVRSTTEGGGGTSSSNSLDLFAIPPTTNQKKKKASLWSATSPSSSVSQSSVSTIKSTPLFASSSSSSLSPPQRLLWSLWLLVVVVMTCLSLFVSTTLSHRQNQEYRDHHHRVLSNHLLQKETATTTTLSQGGETSSSSSLLKEQVVVVPVPVVPQQKRGLEDDPSIAWLLSFPNSGTTYTIANMEHMTNITTATNYAKEASTKSSHSNILQPLFPDLYDAPFVKSPHLLWTNHKDESAKSTWHSHYILTKSHCSGYCDQCHWTQDLQDATSFVEGCRHATFEMFPSCPSTIESRTYSIDTVSKIVHLVRNPFDNLVARMHLGVSERKKSGGYSRQFLRQFTDSFTGLRAWCDYVDASFQDEPRTEQQVVTGAAVARRNQTIPTSTMRLLQQVPCHSEIFRYVQFHNLVIEVNDLLQLPKPAHVVYYEDYNDSSNGIDSLDTMYSPTSVSSLSAHEKLAAFLEQTIVRPKPLPFVSGKTYGHLWTPDEKVQVARLIRHLASPQTWKLLSTRYFDTQDWWMNAEIDMKNQEVAIAASTGMVISAPHTLNNKNQTTHEQQQQHQLVWFLSFPQSGSFMFLSNVMKISNTKMASHYLTDAVAAGTDPKRVFPSWPMDSSPYWIEAPLTVPHLPPNNKKILVRNHCTGGCATCPPVEDWRLFDRICRTVVPPTSGKNNDQQDSAISGMEYNRKKVKEHWILVRNPFDVIRSRTTRGLIDRMNDFGLTQETIVQDFQNQRTGLLKWCQNLDQEFAVQWTNSSSSSVTGSYWDRVSEAYHSVVREATCPARWWWLFPSSYRHEQERYSQLVHENPYPLDRNLVNELLENNNNRDGGGLPCYSDFLRIVQWYNYALFVTRNMPNRRIIRFEDYTNSTTRKSKLKELVKSLELPSGHPPRPFKETRAQHKQLFTPEEARVAARVFRNLASPEGWELFRPYFDVEFAQSNSAASTTALG